ncbi:MAG: F0F1 ATP synthase subunit delta [Anaerolineae bacterium]|nr:F0F1 ATP synthase subunit delta [Anaerolineae bacterium]
MLDINWSTLLLQIVNFLVMVFILTRFFFKPVVRILDERSKKVTSALEEAEQREKRATEMAAEYEQKLVEVQEQVVNMKQSAQEELEQTKQKYLDETRQEIQAMREKAEGELKEARQQGIYQHRRELGHLVTTLSGRLMREAGGDAFQRTAVDRFVERFSMLPAEEVRQALASSESTVIGVQLASASEVSADILERLTGRAQELAGKPVELVHKVDPTMIAGLSMRFGDVIIDGSLSGQLQNLSDRYMADLERDTT